QVDRRELGPRLRRAGHRGEGNRPVLRRQRNRRLADAQSSFCCIATGRCAVSLTCAVAEFSQSASQFRVRWFVATAIFAAPNLGRPALSKPNVISVDFCVGSLFAKRSEAGEWGAGCLMQ